jgi:hypothetical protein
MAMAEEKERRPRTREDKARDRYPSNEREDRREPREERETPRERPSAGGRGVREAVDHPAEPKGEMAREEGSGEMSLTEKHRGEREEMGKLHEDERRDLHGRHREEHRMMNKRHHEEHERMRGEERE